MLTARRLLPAFVISIASLATSTVFGQATRTWVSGVGDDANPCSRTAPCKTFAGAISKTAPAGEIDVLDPGGFGAVTITKSISIEADGVIAGVLVSGTNGIIINAGATDVVVLRGITFDGVGTGLDGIKVITAGTVVVENCYVKGFATRGISVEPTSSSGNPTKVFISNTNVQANTSNGIVVAPAGGQAQVTLDHVSIAENTNFGLSITGGSYVVARNTTIAGNAIGTSFSNVRIDASAGAATLDLDKDVITGAPTGIIALNGATVRVSDSTITNNTTAVSTSALAVVQSYGNNRLTNGAFSSTIPLQ